MAHGKNKTLETVEPVHLTEMNAQDAKLKNVYIDMQQAFVSKRGVAHMAEKVVLLNQAGALITEIDSSIKGAAHLTKPLKRKNGTSDKTSSVQ